MVFAAKEDTATTNLKIFDLRTIKVATNDLSEENKLGEGGFGPVYKGTLDDGQEIAVKRLSTVSGQGTAEFKNEVQLLAKLQHKNLVRLLGCCLEGEEKILVYEYVPNTSLNKFIFDPSKHTEFTWEQLYRIVTGVARGLVYLHEDSRLTVIHRDVKASNILLDDNMNPKIADFGLARLLLIDQTHQDTNKIVGTYGYMSPEYAMHGKFSVKSDVYSFGVLLLEIVSGKRNMAFQELGNQDLLSYYGNIQTWMLWSEGRALELVNPKLLESCPRAEILRCIHIGLLCVQEDPDVRPTVSSILLMLNSTSVTLQKQSTPAFVLDRSRDLSILNTSSSDILDLKPSVQPITATTPSTAPTREISTGYFLLRPPMVQPPASTPRPSAKAPIKCMGLCYAAATSPLKTAGSASRMQAPISPSGARYRKRGPFGWLDYCSLRYSNASFFRVRDDEINYFWDTENKADPVRFAGLAGQLLANLSSDATAGGSGLMFATGETSFNRSIKIYGLVQCTMDLTISDCRTCLAKASGFIPMLCAARLNGVQCSSLGIVIPASAPPNSSPPLAGPPPPPLPLNPSKPSASSSGSAKEDLANTNLKIFDLQTIKVATNYLSEENKLGEGGFGPVYKGTLEDGQKIAVKRLSTVSGQGTAEFKNEVQLVAKLQHKNLVRLLGCCLEGEEKILVYEYVPNTSLNKFIFDPSKHTEFTWEQLYRIVTGVARGLVYLHEDSRLTVIHRDVKASNILLDDNMNPKITDFGLARLLLIDQTHQDTNKIVGTYGYMSPEYAMHGKFSVKSDVYSFGVLLLEIVSGKRNMAFQELGNQDLLSYTWMLWSEGRALELVNPKLLESCPRAEILRCIHIGLLCVQEDPDVRPTVSSILLMLNSTSVTLQKQSTPAFVLDRSRNLSILNTSSSDILE
ncbi:Cysteine-rich receptor-like protein kinase 8 [Nymphaea thermarum]|nr:Cysteine-rich receptor-like protein kinase 8 [Nymphaea thermarum]